MEQRKKESRKLRVFFSNGEFRDSQTFAGFPFIKFTSKILKEISEQGTRLNMTVLSTTENVNLKMTVFDDQS